MAKDLNNVTLSGRLGSDPTAKILPSGVEVAEFRLANNKLGSDEPNWFNINVYGAAARFANQYLKKGARVLVVGRIEIRQYQDQQGVSKIAVSIESNDVISFNDGDGNRAENDAPAPQARQSRQPNRQPSQSHEEFEQRAAEAQQMMAQQQGKLTQLVNKKAAQNMNTDDIPF